MNFLLLLILFLVVVPTPALAYLDPGTGSYLIQILVGGGLGLTFIIKQYWSTIRSFFSKGKTDEKKSANKAAEKESNED